MGNRGMKLCNVEIVEHHMFGTQVGSWTHIAPRSSCLTVGWTSNHGGLNLKRASSPPSSHPPASLYCPPNTVVIIHTHTISISVIIKHNHHRQSNLILCHACEYHSKSAHELSRFFINTYSYQGFQEQGTPTTLARGESRVIITVLPIFGYCCCS